MKHQEGTFKGSAGGDIYYQWWLPDEAPRAVILIVHGLAEHSGRYGNVVDHFVPRGYALFGFDLPGHGKSFGRRVHVHRFKDYTDTVDRCLSMVRTSFPDIPLFLIGHSMGGLIAATYLLEHQDRPAAAVLSAPSVKAHDNLSPLTVALGKVLSFLMPGAGILQLEAEGVSRDTNVVQAYEKDPLVYRGKVTARLAAELLAAMRRLSAEASRITLPLLLLQGSADRLVDPEGARRLYDKVSSSDKKILIYEGLYHEVFNEPEHARVLQDVDDWLELHLR